MTPTSSEVTPSQPVTTGENQLAMRLQSDRAALLQQFSRCQRLHVPDVLSPEFASSIADALEDDEIWRVVLNEGPKHFDLHRTQLDALDLPRRELLAEQVAGNASSGFQYMFDNFPIADSIQNDCPVPPVLVKVYELINSPAFLQFIRDITGEERVAFADCQATRFRSGHFLTAHDDNVDGKNRLFAFVLNFTRVWRIDWGGLLLFHGADGHVDEGYTPAFNALNIMRVPQAHAVSFVTPSAAAPRLSITGWFRAA